MNKKTIAITLNYKNFKDSVEAVDSLLLQTIPFFKIIIVDNCSFDGSYEKLCNYYKDHEIVKVIKSDYNGGFAYGNNFAMKYCFSQYQFDYFLLINNDTISDAKMLEVFEQSWERLCHTSKLGILCGKIYYYSNPELIWSAGGYISTLKLCGYHYGIGEIDKGQFEIEKKVSFATGCLLFFSKELIKSVGFLSEDYFMYVEDLDFCYKTLQSGYNIYYIPQAVIWHKINSVFLKNSNKTNYFFPNRNRIIFGRKYKKGFVKTIAFTFMIVSRFIRFFQFLLKGKLENPFKGILAGFLYSEKKGKL